MQSDPVLSGTKLCILTYSRLTLSDFESFSNLRKLPCPDYLKCLEKSILCNEVTKIIFNSTTDNLKNESF